MFKRKAVLLVALLVVVALFVGAQLGGLSVMHPTQAQVTKALEARKWEYCAIAGVNWDSKRNSSSATIGFITATGRRFETWDAGSSGDPLSIAIARLGSEGWEVVGQVVYNPGLPEYRPDTLLFKRPAL
ncbi:MAG TPA: hypothetical protein VI837_13835 [Blastocatellia bacterium]|nr:hypothetical protein [Blastocatellia bacterium]